MPTYDYECELCGHRFEKNVSIAARDMQYSCPECHHYCATKRVISFKGLTWAPTAGGMR